MKILVCISSVPDTTSKINFSADGKSFDKTGVQFVINPHDEFALTRAVWFQEKQGANITVVTIGDASVEPVIRKALAIGADQAIRVNAEAEDSLYVAKQIAKIAQEGGYDLILTGRESIDYNAGAVPGLVASILKMPFVNGCVKLEVEGSTLTATREIDGGKQNVSASLPAVIAAQKGLVSEDELKIPNMRGIMQARTKPLTVVEPEAVNTNLKAISFEAPPARSSVKLFDVSDVASLVRALNQEAKVI
ncbi:MAG: electron transfer flavoprotein subunit alpha [Flavobacteriaceae bacterium]|nr:MAG: electron transfer flavoprotein subunit alpha [Flavobacteriaceae bacterium]